MVRKMSYVLETVFVRADVKKLQDFLMQMHQNVSMSR